MRDLTRARLGLGLLACWFAVIVGGTFFYELPPAIYCVQPIVPVVGGALLWKFRPRT